MFHQASTFQLRGKRLKNLLKHKAYDSGKFWLYGYCVYYCYNRGRLYIRSVHRGERFTTKWRVKWLEGKAENITPLEELVKPKTAGKIPRIAIKVHYSAVRRLGFKPVKFTGCNLQIATCKYKGKCAFKWKVKGRYTCEWPDTCNQKEIVTP